MLCVGPFDKTWIILLWNTNASIVQLVSLNQFESEFRDIFTIDTYDEIFSGN